MLYSRKSLPEISVFPKMFKAKFISTRISLPAEAARQSIHANVSQDWSADPIQNFHSGRNRGFQI